MLTIIAARRYPQDDIGRFLRSLPAGVEVIIADGVGGLVSDRPNVRVLALPGRTLAELRGAALAEASSDVVAFIDPACRLTPSWLEAAHRALAGAPAASGPVAYDGGRSLATWAAFLAEYGAFLPPSSAAAGVAGTNFVVRRSLLAGNGPFWKDEVVAGLRAAGRQIVAAPDLVVIHRRRWQFLPFLRDRFHHGRCYAGRRQRRIPPVERFARALAAPLTGLLLFGRLARAFWPKRRRRPAFVLAAPWTVSFLLAWAFGEAIGYLLGPGESCRQT
jgi:glycosyltransferase involved in cell wall biosynthesis